MKKSFIAIFVVLSALMACNKDNASPISVQEEQTVNEVIPLEEAMANLEEFLSSYTNVTKAAKTRSIADAEVFTFGSRTLKTKAGGIEIPDTLAYLVNLGNEEGFAVLAANRKLNNSIYCLTEEGRVDQENFAQAYAYLSGQLETRSGSEIMDMEEMFVPTLLTRALVFDYYDQNNQVSTKATTPSGSPTGPILQTKWHQNTPFNDLLNDCPAGCVAIACAQIMAYNEYPENPTFNSTTCSWTEMKTVAPVGNRYSSGTADGKIQVAAFLKELGKDDNLKIRYDDDGSWGLADGVVRTLKNYGYKNVDKRIGFVKKDRSKVSECLAKDYPVFMNGGNSSDLTGHAWVVDGEWGNYFHCNWGWRGLWDGYYVKDNFFDLSSDPNDIIFDDTDPGTVGSTADKFNWCFREVLYSM